MKKIRYILSFFLSIPSSVVISQTIQQIGYYNVNGISSMSSISNYMILGNGSIINISNPTSPILIANLSFSGFSTSVLVSDNYSYFGAGMTGKLIIADVSNPNLPLQVSSRIFPSITGGIFGISKNNNVLYLASGQDGVYNVDVTDPVNPIVLDSIVIPNGQARDIFAYSNFAFVAHYDGLKAIDISDPANINVISTIGSGYNSIDIDTITNLAFLGKTFGGIDVFNISNPHFPSLVFSIPNSNGTALDIKYRDNLVYLATDNLGLFIYKITGSSGVQMANFPNTSNGQSFAISLQDSLILLSGLINGVAILKYDSSGVPVIIDDKDFDQISISPNPATNYVDCNFKNENIIEIEIICFFGKSIYKVNNTSTTNRIDVSNLPKGNYTLRFKNKNRSWNKIMIKSE